MVKREPASGIEPLTSSPATSLLRCLAACTGASGGSACLWGFRRIVGLWCPLRPGAYRPGCSTAASVCFVICEDDKDHDDKCDASSHRGHQAYLVGLRRSSLLSRCALRPLSSPFIWGHFFTRWPKARIQAASPSSAERPRVMSSNFRSPLFGDTGPGVASAAIVLFWERIEKA